MLLAAAVTPAPVRQVIGRVQFDHDTQRGQSQGQKLKQLKSSRGSPVMDVSSHPRVSGNVFFFFGGKREEFDMWSTKSQLFPHHRRHFETARCL